MPTGAKRPPGVLDYALVRVIRARMDTTGKTQTALARAAGISDSQMSRILARMKPMTVGELAAFGECLGVPVAQLMTEAEAEIEGETDAQSEPSAAGRIAAMR